MPKRSYLTNEKLLLIDLDGVLVTDGFGDTQIGSEIITIHSQLAKKIDELHLPVAILTHRSRGEALQIINALKLSNQQLLGIFTANDIFLHGLRYKGLSFLIRNGSKKSIVLSYIEKRHNILAKNIAFIDDRPENVEDLLNAGIGLGINVPAAKVIGNTRIKTFDLNYVLEKVNVWSKQEDLSCDSSTRLNLQPVTINLTINATSGIIMKRKWSDLFGLGRTGLRYTRQFILKLL